MNTIEFVKGLDKDKVYIFEFQPNTWPVEQVSEFFIGLKKLGIQGIGVYAGGGSLQILEPVSILIKKS